MVAFTSTKLATPSPDARRAGFLPVGCGGFGSEAVVEALRSHAADGGPVLLETVRCDTEPTSHHAAFDHSLTIRLTAAKLSALRADPEKYGVAARAIVEQFPQLLNVEDSQNGARTIRLLTQLALAAYQDEILKTVRTAVYRLAQRGATQIRPIFVASSGGGTGSALLVLLADAFQRRRFAQYVTQGLPSGLLATPLILTCDPFALANLHRGDHPDRILANCFATRLELAELERRQAVKWVLRVGFSNDQGTLLMDLPTAISVVGTSLYELMHQFDYIKNRTVDNAEISALGTGFSGRNLPERLFPELLDGEGDEAPFDGENGIS